MDGLYTILPLQWFCHRDDPVEGEWWQADTVFGALHVESEPGGPALWRYCFDEYYDEASHECESVAAGKAAAEAFYLGRLLPALKKAVN